MSLLVVMSQPLRQAQAATLLRSREPKEKKLVVTRDARLVDVSRFPTDTEFDSWDAPGGLSSAAGVSNRLLAKAGKWLTGGSPWGARMERWLKSADWRLRYVHRVRAAIQSVRHGVSAQSDTGLRLALEGLAEAHEIDDVVVFDLFDLPTVVALSEKRGWKVRVL